MTFSQCDGTHAASMVCWLCSDRMAWWRDARVKAGLPAEPPNAHPNAVPKPEPEPVPVCMDCGGALTKHCYHGRCFKCAVRHSNRERALQVRTVRRMPLAQRYESYLSRPGPLGAQR